MRKITAKPLGCVQNELMLWPVSDRASVVRQPILNTPKPLTQRPAALIALLLVVFAALAAACTPVTNTPAASTPVASSATPATPDATAAVMTWLRSVTECRQPPAFTKELDLTASAFFGTNVAGHTGLAIADPTNNSVLQDDTWDDAGNLGPYVLDGLGNLWTAPVPLTSLELNPPDLQNKIYRVDTNTAKMAEYVELAPARPPSEFNPFGIVGLAYDCETNSLYATSLMGSTPTEQVGRVFRVDLNNNTASLVLEGADVMGVGVADTSEGKRLFYGLARSGEVRSLPLDAAGNAAGDSRSEFNLAALAGGAATDRPQRITVDADGNLEVKGVDFTYSLRISGQTVPTIYVVRLNGETGEWEAVSVEKQPDLREVVP